MGGITNASGGGIGSGQTWQNMTASRALGATYTNTSGKPIMVSLYPSGGNTGGFDFYVDGQVVNHVYQNSGYGMAGCAIIVPNNSTYSTNSNGGFQYWMELR